ncbi:MAG: hypothetical protein H0T77_06740 [Pyrinomonadaceae bacterium]|nr:hypothetical protein [Pyrinomonadaceae bacterium]
MKGWLQRERSHLKKGELLRRAKLKLVGHLNYYAITDNWEMCNAFRIEVTRLLYHWLNRQSQKRSYEWERFNDALAWVRWPPANVPDRCTVVCLETLPLIVGYHALNQAGKVKNQSDRAVAQLGSSGDPWPA